MINIILVGHRINKIFISIFEPVNETNRHEL